MNHVNNYLHPKSNIYDGFFKWTSDPRIINPDTSSKKTMDTTKEMSDLINKHFYVPQDLLRKGTGFANAAFSNWTPEHINSTIKKETNMFETKKALKAEVRRLNKAISAISIDWQDEKRERLSAEMELEKNRHKISTLERYNFVAGARSQDMVGENKTLKYQLHEKENEIAALEHVNTNLAAKVMSKPSSVVEVCLTCFNEVVKESNGNKFCVGCGLRVYEHIPSVEQRYHRKKAIEMRDKLTNDVLNCILDPPYR